jgi:urea carboxylase-associated protein 2
MGDTATTHGARAQARSLAGTAARFQPTVPATSATDLPAGVSAADVIWDETLGGGSAAAHRLPRGTVVRLTDLEGEACANVLVFNARHPLERLNVADTVKVQWQAYLGAGSLLLSDMGRVLMSIATDTSGRHDALCGCSNERRNAAKYGSGAVHGPFPNARDRFAVALAKYGLDRRDIVPSINLFKGVRVEPDGALVYTGGTGPGAFVEVRAELPVIVAIANTPHVLNPHTVYDTTALRITAWSDHATSRDDALWTSTPEAERAFLNTESFIQEWEPDRS